MKKKFSLVLVLLFLLGTLSGCGRADSEDKEISIMLPASPVTIDPQLISDTNGGFVASFYTAGLFGYDPDKKLNPVLAEKYEVSDDGLTYTFHLKKDLKWSDGRALTASDFVYGFQRLADPDVGSNSVYLVTDSCMVKNADDVTSGQKPVSELGVSAPDDLTFVVELEKPCPYFCALLTMASFSPCNEDFYHSAGDDYATSESTILSCGPYVMDRYEPLAMQIHFTKNPNYVAADKITIPGANLQVVANQQQSLMSYESGGLDITSVSGDLVELAQDDPEMKEYPTASTFFLDINHRECKELQNDNIRMALAKSIDRDSIVKNILRAGNTPLTRINPAGYYQLTDGTDIAADPDKYKEQAGYDPAAAAELWKKGLQELGVSQVKFTLVFSGNSSVVEAVGDEMKQTLPGLDLELKTVTQKDLMQAKSKGEYDLLFYGWVADYADPTAFLALFLSSASEAGYDNPDYDALYDKIQSEEISQDPDKRDELMEQAEDMLMKDMAVIPLFSKGQAYLIKSNVTGFQINPTGIGCILTGLKKEVN